MRQIRCKMQDARYRMQDTDKNIACTKEFIIKAI